MALGTPNSGTIQEAQGKIASLLTPETEQPEASDTPEEQQEVEAAPDPEEGQPEEELVSEPEEESPDYTEEEEEAPRTFKFKVRGQEREVTEDELIKLASMGEDYTQKTQDLAEQRKRLEAITSESDAARTRMSQLLPELETNLLEIEKQLNAEPDWEKLYAADPGKAAQLQHQFAKKKAENQAELEKVRAEQQRTLAEEQQRLSQARQDHLAEQGKLLLQNLPEWKDDKTATSEKAEIEKWALSNGYLDQSQLNNITDWGSVAMMRKAWLYDQGKSKVAKQKTRPKSKTLSPGSKGSAPRRDNLKSQKENFQKTRKMSDARHLVEGILNQSTRR